MQFLKYLYFIITSVVGVSKTYRNYKADKSIKEKGYVINDKRPFKEKLVSFIKDYTYIFAPIIHFAIPALEAYKNDDEYENDRLNRLISYGIVSKQDEVKEEVKEVKVVSEKKEEVKKEEKKEIKVEDMSLEDQISYYNKLDNDYRQRYKLLKETNGSVSERNKLVREVINIENKLESLNRQLEIKKLREERERVTSKGMIK